MHIHSRLNQLGEHGEHIPPLLNEGYKPYICTPTPRHIHLQNLTENAIETHKI